MGSIIHMVGRGWLAIVKKPKNSIEVLLWGNCSILKVGLSWFNWCQNFVLIIFFLPATKNLRCNIQIFSLMNVALTQIFCSMEEENYEYKVLAPIESRYRYIQLQPNYNFLTIQSIKFESWLAIGYTLLMLDTSFWLFL